MASMLNRCKACCFKPKKKEEEKSQGQGYSVTDFVNDGLVPVWGYACWRPLDPKKQSELAKAIKPLNHRVTQRMDKNTRQVPGSGGAGAGEAGVPKAAELPLEVVCLVGLWGTEVDTSFTKQSFDFNQEASLKVTVNGALNFPPGVEPKDPEVILGKKADPRADEKDPRWWLRIDVTAVLKVDTDDADEDENAAHENKNKTKLKVKCEKLEIDRSVQDKEDWRGDPMVDSWLPVNDILQEIEAMLDHKLQLVIQGLDNKEK